MTTPTPLQTETTSRQREPVSIDAATRHPRIAALIVTWNRHAMVERVLEALSRQRYPLGRLDVVVVDNNSTDGTTDVLRARFRPDAIVDNPTARAHEPAFGEPERDPAGNTLGFSSLTVIRNAENHGGCGGFNTGFGYVAHALAGSELSPDYVWLVDDDIDLPDDTLPRLVEVGESDTKVGLVGARTVDIGDRKTTIETTVYFHGSTGVMGDSPDAGHRQEASHREWVDGVGGVRGLHDYSGTREVDVVSACSMLARWSAVEEVGFWDWRYFIYCDDADWCMRFGNAGYRVVLNLDAVVYHTPWHHKLTPARLYYAQRNLIWMLQKFLPTDELRRLTTRRLGSLVRDAWRAMWQRRQSHAEVIRRTAADVVSGKSGKLDLQSPKAGPIAQAMDEAGVLRAGQTVAFACPHAGMLPAAAAVRDAIAAYLREAGRESDTPSFVEIVRNDVPGAQTAPAGVERVVYSTRRRSVLRRQLGLLPKSPALVVFDNTNDFALLAAGVNVHVDHRSPDTAFVERDTPWQRLAFVAKLGVTAVRSMLYARGVEPFVRSGRYG